MTLAPIERGDIFVPGRSPFQKAVSVPDLCHSYREGTHIEKCGGTLLSAHTDPDAEMSLGRGNTVEHVQCMRIETLAAPNTADALEGGITGGIAAAHARAPCLDVIRELVNMLTSG